MNELKTFTLDEANKLLPQLTSLIGQLQKKRELLLNLEVEIDALELVSETPKAKTKEQNPVVAHKVEEYTAAVNSFYQGVDEIHATGCFLKDMDLGLIDFYSVYQGKVVYLCWKMGETQVSHWHEIGQGYTSRQPILKPHS